MRQQRLDERVELILQAASREHAGRGETGGGEDGVRGEREKEKRSVRKGAQVKSPSPSPPPPPPTTIFPCNCSRKVWSGAATSLACRSLPSQPQQPDRDTQSLSTHLFSLSLSLTHSHTRAHRQRCRPHTHTLLVSPPGSVAPMTSPCSMQSRTRVSSPRHGVQSARMPVDAHAGRRGPLHAPTPVGFWPPPEERT